MKQADTSKEARKTTKQKASKSRLDKQHSKTHDSSQDKSERDVRIRVDQVISSADLDNLSKSKLFLPSPPPQFLPNIPKRLTLFHPAEQHLDLLQLSSDEQKEFVRRAFANDDVMAVRPYHPLRFFLLTRTFACA